MTSEHVPELYALAVEPRSARAGETLELTFRTRNQGAAPSPPGTVTFVLDDGLTALDDLDVEVGPAEPGDDVLARVRARAPATCEDRTVLAARARFRAGDATFRTNAAHVTVRSSPILDGGASGTHVLALDDERVRVRATLVNEGDGPAHGLRVVVPPPHACERTDGPGPAVARLAVLAPGERHDVTFDARIVRPASVLRCDGAAVECADGRCAVLPVREVLPLAAAIEPPVVTLTTERRRLDVAIDVRNAGWVEARDVRVAIAVPPGLRLVDGSARVDGVPCAAGAARRRDGDPVGRVERERGGWSVAVASVPPRAHASVEASFETSSALEDGEVRVSAGAHETSAPIARERAHDVRLMLPEARYVAGPGDVVSVAALLVNGGDDAARVVVGLCAPDADAPPNGTPRTIPACSLARIELPLAIAHDTADGAVVEHELVACGERGEIARTPLRVDVRERSVAADPERDDAQRDAASVRARLHAPHAVSGGAAFDVRLDVDVSDAVERVAVRGVVPDGARYVAGSCRIDGRALLDPRAPAGEDNGFPLGADGVVLGGVPAGAQLSISWQLFAPGHAEESNLTLRASIDADSQPVEVAERRVVVEPRATFAAVPAHVPFRLAGCALAPAPRESGDGPSVAEHGAHAADLFVATTDPADVVMPAAEPEISPPAAPTAHARVLRLDPARLDAVRRLQRALMGPGFVAHLFALRFFFPETDAADPSAAAFDRARAELDDVFDRVYVKLRIPGFVVSTDDLDDARLRDALAALFDAIGTAPSVRVASCGSPAVLRAIAAMLDTPCPDDPRVADGVAAHARALDAALARYDGLPLEVFDDALARGRDDALDAARRTLIDALAPHVLVEHAAC